MGTPGHMQHPFDVKEVQTGLDLLEYFNKIVNHLKENGGSVKFDGINVSFKLVNDDSKPSGKDFRMDRGTSHIESVVGMTADDAYTKWPQGHGMPPAIDDLLRIFNKALPLIEPELKQLGMWDDPTKFFNTEYMKKGKTNVIEYPEPILAIHSINQFYEKKAQKWRVERGQSMDRPGLARPTDPETGKPLTDAGSTEISYNRGILEQLIEKVKPIAIEEGYNLVGDVLARLVKDVDFTNTLNSQLPIHITEKEIETRSLKEWLSVVTNPGHDTVLNINERPIWAISKDVYVQILQKNPLSNFLSNINQDMQKAIAGAVFNEATRKLGNDVKAALESEFGNLYKHEGVVLRGLEAAPVKVTGNFILEGLATTFRDAPETEPEKEYDFVSKRKIALIAGGFRPPHRGHVSLVSDYLERVGPKGGVTIFMSRSENPKAMRYIGNDKTLGDPVTVEQSMQIWKIYLENEGIYNRVDFVLSDGGPIGEVVDLVKISDPEDVEYYLAAGGKDGKRYEFILNDKRYNPNNVTVHIEPTPTVLDSNNENMSATTFRRALANLPQQMSIILDYIPRNSEKNVDKILTILGVGLGSSVEDELEDEEKKTLTMESLYSLVEDIMNEKKLTPAETKKKTQIAKAIKRDNPDMPKDKKYAIATDTAKRVAEEDEEELEEISSVSGGALHGASGQRKDVSEEESLIRESIKEPLIMEFFNREEFLEEIKMRKVIREAIKTIKIKKTNKQQQIKLEEQNLRNVIRDYIKEAKEEHYFDNTGINKLAKLFKKTQMLTTLKDGFKSLRSGKEQRDSFRAHIINGIENLLQPYRNMLGDEGVPADQPALGESPLEEQEEEGITLDMSDEDKMIGDDGLPVKAAEEEEAPSPEEKEREDFSIPGYDQTADQKQGRTDALTAFKNVNKQIEEMYIDIESQDDREMFYDWLLTNMKLYFDQWEEETQANVQEPTTDEYEKQAQTATETDSVPEPTAEMPPAIA
jgi:hypothetical protein